MYSFCAMYSLRMSFWSVPEIFFQSAPCFSATARYMAQMTAAGELMVIGVVAHQGGKIESGGEASLSLGEEITESLVGVFGGAESRELAHGPKAPAVHRGMDAARIRRLTGKTEVTARIPVWQISIRIQPANRMPGDGREFRLSFGTFFQR